MRVDRLKMAVYFDAENIGLSCVPGVLRYLEDQQWDTHLKRAYGAQLQQSAEILREFSVVPVHVLSQKNKKNIADIALIIDAMQELCQGAADGFCIVTGDSDFTLLVQRIRELGKTVLLCGNHNTPAALRNACTQFLELRTPGEKEKGQPAAKEQASAAEGKAAAPPPAQPSAASRLNLGDPEVAAQARAGLREAFLRCANGREVVSLSDLGTFIADHAPELSRKRYGVGMLSTLLKAVGNFEVEMAAFHGGHKGYVARLRDGQAPAENTTEQAADDGGAAAVEVGDTVYSGAEGSGLSP